MTSIITMLLKHFQQEIYGCFSFRQLSKLKIRLAQVNLGKAFIWRYKFLACHLISTKTRNPFSKQKALKAHLSELSVTPCTFSYIAVICYQSHSHVSFTDSSPQYCHFIHHNTCHWGLLLSLFMQFKIHCLQSAVLCRPLPHPETNSSHPRPLMELLFKSDGTVLKDLKPAVNISEIMLNFLEVRKLKNEPSPFSVTPIIFSDPSKDFVVLEKGIQSKIQYESLILLMRTQDYLQYLKRIFPEKCTLGSQKTKQNENNP